MTFTDNNSKIKKPSIFLDRDGTINEDTGYLFEIDRLRFIPGSLEALRILQNYYLLFIITNQAGIGEGVFSENKYSVFKEHYDRIFYKEKIHITETLHCPHTKEMNCNCRKPSPYFIGMLSEKYHVDIKTSFVIGDHPGDVKMGELAGCKSIYLLSGHGEKHLGEIDRESVYIAENLYKAALYISSLKQDNSLKSDN